LKNKHKLRVLVTFDSMKNANTGLYSFGYGLGNALLKENNGRFKLNYYLKFKSRKVFANKVRMVFLLKFHKLFFPGYKKYDVVHFTDQFCRLKPTLIKSKKVITIHDLNQIGVLKDRPERLKAFFTAMSTYIAKCDKVVAISQFVAKDILKHFPEAEGKISVIYNGADKLIPVEGHLPAYVPQRKFLFTIGHVSEKKNFHVLPALLQNNDLELVIAGIITPYQEKIMAEAAKYGCQDRVIITGPVSDADKTWYYQHSEAFLFPSLTEGFGLPVIEAMYFGKPVFLSTYTSLPEIGGHLAYYFKNFDPAKMQQVLADGLADFDQNNLVETIKQHAEQFTWAKTAQKYLKLYEELISNQPFPKQGI